MSIELLALHPLLLLGARQPEMPFENQWLAPKTP